MPTINGRNVQAPLLFGNPLSFTIFETKDRRQVTPTGLYPRHFGGFLSIIGAAPNREFGHRTTFNANYLVRDDIMVFARGGWSEGWLIDRNLAGGFGWRPFQDYSDLFGFGLGWARPTSPLLDDQYLFEVFYRYQLTPNLAITPDVQLIVNPALNPSVTNLWVFSLRARLTF